LDLISLILATVLNAEFFFLAQFGASWRNLPRSSKLELSGIIMEINDLRLLDVASPGKPKFKVQGSKFKVETNPLQFSPINWVGLMLPFPAGHYPLSPNHYSCPYFKEQARERHSTGHYHL
jgi:hypothetical protein